jgi:hypothetical protein
MADSGAVGQVVPPSSLSLALHTSFTLFTRRKRRAMIRREPTMVPLGELDVQDVKDFVHKQRRERERDASAAQREEEMTIGGYLTGAAGAGLGGDAAAARKDAREERLGMR